MACCLLSLEILKAYVINLNLSLHPKSPLLYMFGTILYSGLLKISSFVLGHATIKYQLGTQQ